MEAYGHGPWNALCRAHFRLERWEAARQFAARALERQPPQPKWLEDMACWDFRAAADPLPPQWREWTEGNLRAQVPRRTVIRILEENGHAPAQIIASLKLFDSAASRKPPRD